MRGKFRRLCAIFFALCLMGCVLPGMAAAKQIATYKDIPGVTKQDIEQIEALKTSHPEGLVYGMLASEEAFVTQTGELEGFAALASKHLSELFDIPITLRVYMWDELLEGLLSHEIDLSSELTSTPERLESYYMTTRIVDRSLELFHSDDREDLDIIYGDTPLRYGFLRDSTTFDRVTISSEVPFVATFFNNFQEAIAAVAEDVIDGFILEGMGIAAFSEYRGIAHQKYYPLVYSPVSLSTADGSVKPLIDVVQKYLDNSGDEVFFDLYAEGMKQFLTYRFSVQLTQQERDYIEAHKASGVPIPFVTEFDSYPISFYNKQEAQWQGISHDILREVESLTGLAFEPINASDAPFAQIIEKLEAGEAAMITELVKTRGRSGRFLWSAVPFAEDSFSLISLIEKDDVALNMVFKEKVGLIEKTAYEEIFHRLFPEHTNTAVYQDCYQGFEALEKREIDLLMLPGNLMLSMTHYLERPYFKVNVPIDVDCLSHFGFNQNEAILCSIIDKAQQGIDCKGIEYRWKRRSYDYFKKLSEQRIPYIVGIALLVVILLLLVILLYRRRERYSRQLGMTDALTQLPNRHHYDQRLEIEWRKAIKNRASLALLTIDLDHFKTYNDTYGHPQGDTLLQQLAKIFSEVPSREGDMVARVGGEEFAVILPNTDFEGAMLIANRLRKSVEDAIVINARDGKPTQATISVGVACIRPSPEDSLDKFISESDEALYRAKNSGRNRVC